MSSYYTHGYKTVEAKAISVALALMSEQEVATWDEVNITSENRELVERISASYYDLTPYLRMPTKIEGSRSLTPAVSLAICTKCHGWQTIALTKGRSVASGVSISDAAAAKVTCIQTTDCTGAQEVVLPATREQR
jgi:hypothetical protein